MKQLKTTVFLNRIPANYNIQADFATAQAYHLKHGVEWDYTFVNVDVHGYTSILGKNAMGNTRWLIENSQSFLTLDPNADVNIFCFDEAEWSSPVGSQFPLLPNTPTGCTYLVNGKPFVNIATYLSDHTQGITGVEIAHELVHCLTYLANLAGFNIVDQLDTYFENNLQDLPNSNFMIQWGLLQPFLNAQNALTAVLTRNIDNTYKETTGSLTVGNWSCKTLELSWLNNQPNISCIPKGNYLCKWKFKLNSLAYHYELQLVPNRSGIFIHAGNYATGSKVDTAGCILLGASYNDLDGNGTPDIISSNLVLSAFEKLMAKKDFTLIIQ